MKVIWLGQAGLYLQLDGVNIIVDPYLSDSVGALDPRKSRRFPVPQWVYELPVDVLAFTHDHLDHYDPESVARYLAREEGITVLAPGTCWQKVRQHRDIHNYVLFNESAEWTEKGIRFVAVPAVHSDPNAIGFFIFGKEESIYITGDTLYSRRILNALPCKPDVIFLPINGVGNNMNPEDAARFAADSGASLAVPLHTGLMDDLSGQLLPLENKLILEVFRETQIGETK